MTDNAKSWAGLLAFAGTVLAALAVLVGDLGLYLGGAPTVTQRVAPYPGAAAALVLGSLLGPLGLCCHFYYYARAEEE